MAVQDHRLFSFLLLPFFYPFDVKISTFSGTELPPFERYSPGKVCPQLGGTCSKLAYWLQVRGKICPDPRWRPQFNQSTIASEDAAYLEALHRETNLHMTKDCAEPEGLLKRKCCVRLSNMY